VNAGLWAVRDRRGPAERLFRIVIDDPEAGGQLGRALLLVQGGRATDALEESCIAVKRERFQ
jgi:hypothetical protein